jgi:hypothetical protein
MTKYKAKNYIVALIQSGHEGAVPIRPADSKDSVTAQTFEALQDAVVEAERHNRVARDYADISPNNSIAVVFKRIDYTITETPSRPLFPPEIVNSLAKSAQAIVRADGGRVPGEHTDGVLCYQTDCQFFHHPISRGARVANE